MSEPVDPKPQQPVPGPASGPADPWRPQQPASGPSDPWRPPPASADEQPTEHLGWPPAGGGSWAPPPVDGPRAEPHTVFLGDTSAPPAPAGSSPRRSAKGALSATGLVLAGLLVGAVAVWAVQSQSSDAAQTSATSGTGTRLPFGQNNGNGQVPNGQVPNGQVPNGQVPNGQVPNGGGNGGFGGGLPGEQRLVGTISAIGSSTLTVKVQGGSSHTYTVGSGTEIVRNGSRAALSDLEVGDLAFLHVYPQGATMMVERIFAGTLPGGGQGRPGFGGGPGGGPDDQNGPDGSGTGSSTTT